MLNFLGALLIGFFAFPKAAQASLTKAKEVFGPPAPNRSHDIDILARTIWGEARGEGARGMQAVANVIMNRYRLSNLSLSYRRQFGGTVAEICRKPAQFSVWNFRDPNYSLMQRITTADHNFSSAIGIARAAIEGRLPDITGGADHYHTAAVSPDWSQGETPVRVIGAHEFYKLA